MERHVLEDRFFTDHTYGVAEFPDSARREAVVDYANPLFDEDDLPQPVAALEHHDR
jgi:hypothetical protein